MATFETRQTAHGDARVRVKVRLMEGKRTKTFPDLDSAKCWAARMEVQLKLGDVPGDIDPRVLACCERWPIPERPNFTMPETDQRWLVPDAKGVYFLWEGERIAYVGQACGTLGFRSRLWTHQHVGPGSVLTLLALDNDIGAAESWYIGVLDPPLNRLKGRARDE